MKTIPLKDILVSPERQRRTFNAESMEQLRNDIEENGLYNAVVLRRAAAFPTDPDAGRWSLVQGERRLRAISDLYDLGGTLAYDGETLPPGHVPYTTLGELDPLRAEIAELHENLKRENLTWQEEAAATKKIAALRAALAMQAGTAPPTTMDIAREVRDVPLDAKAADTAAFDTTRKEIIVADHLHDPDVQAAKTLRDAYKVVKRKETAERNAALAESVGRTFSAASHTILHTDALSWLATCPDNQFDVICTDQPFGMGADDFGDSGGKAAGAHFYKDDEKIFYACLHALLQHSARITRPQAHLYWFCDIDRFTEARGLFTRAGWQVHRTPLIWHKLGDKGRVPLPDHGPRRSYELILYALKGKKPVTQIAPDVLSYAPDENLGHPAQKPVGLLQDLLKRSVVPGNRVLDCFAGTGGAVAAAHELKCTATLVEQDAAAYGIILNRMKELK